MAADILGQAIAETSHLQAGPLKTTLRDLALSVEWHDLRSVRLAATEWSVIIGHKRKEDPLRAVLPLPLHTTSLKPSSLKSIFNALSNLPVEDLPPPITPLAPSTSDLQAQITKTKLDSDSDGTSTQLPPPDAAAAENNRELDREMIYISIVTSDSTVVYYKLSKGLRKPTDIPDE